MIRNICEMPKRGIGGFGVSDPKKILLNIREREAFWSNRDPIF